MHDAPASVTYLFSDIEGSTRLWEQQPELMRPALARHDAIAREVVVRHRGQVVKMTGDGVHAAFADPLDAVHAVLELQQAMAAPDVAHGLPLRIRSGLHSGVDERRDNDYFGPAVNRAARIMSAAHGGQVLVSQAVADLVRQRLPDEVSLRDLGSVRLRDLANAERLFQVVHPALRADFPALRSLEATPNNLAQQLNSFIGRERETAEVRELLAANRLVTLLGMGGIGKSRLSVQLGADVLDDFADGVWLVELAPLSDPLLVPQAVASVLGVKEEAGRPVMEALVRFVRDRQILIILDNCEHVIHACAELTKQLLQAGPGVKVLASSRDYLQIAGEQTYHVPTLSAPAPEHRGSLVRLAGHESVRLFVDRVAAARPGFALTERNAEAVADICYRLDGIPLAIELAAARARSVSVENIAARLNDRFRLLVTNDRTVLPRQRTLRALIDWSYDLLDARERLLFERLSVFAGGWTLEAAEAVCADTADGIAGADADVGEAGSQVAGPGRQQLAPARLERADVLDLQTQLVEKSLVVMDVDGDRYRMLDTVRQYAHERLNAGPNGPSVRNRHLAFCVALVEQARPELFGPEQGTWLARLDLERENLLSAHAWCEWAPDGAELDLRLVFALKFYWLNRGILALGRRVTLEALARPGADARTFARCRGLCDAGQLCCFMGRYEEAQGYLEESLAIAREIDDPARIVAVLQPLTMASVGRGDVAAAHAYSEEAVRLARSLGNKRQLASALNAFAQLQRIEKRFGQAQALYEEALVLAREMGDQEVIAIGLLNLAMVSIGMGTGERAGAMLREVLQIAREIGSMPAGQGALEVTAGLCAWRAQWLAAARLFGAVEAQAARTGLKRDAVDEAFLAPLMASSRDALGAADFEAAAAAGRALSYGDALGEAERWLQPLEDG